MNCFGPCSCEITLGGGCGCSPPPSLTLREYQDRALDTDTTHHLEWDYYAIGIGGEAGEILEHVKKHERDDAGELTPERQRKVIKELGDVLWYVAVCSKRLGLGLEEVAQINLDKLADRKENGTLHGDGDER